MIRRDPKDFVLTAGGDAEYLAAVRGLYGKGKQAGTLEFKNHFYLERGPYEIVAVVDENADTEPFVLEGKFIDLFDPALPVLTRRAVLPGTQALLYNLDKVADPGRPQVLACAACVETERVGRNGYSFMVKGPAQTTNVMRVLLPRKLRRAVCPLSDGLRKKRTRPAMQLPGVCVSVLRALFVRAFGNQRRVGLTGLVADVHEVVFRDSERTVVGVQLRDDILASGVGRQIVDVAQLVEFLVEDRRYHVALRSLEA